MRLPISSAAIRTGEPSRSKIDPCPNTREGNTGIPTIGELPSETNVQYVARENSETSHSKPPKKRYAMVSSGSFSVVSPIPSGLTAPLTRSRVWEVVADGKGQRNVRHFISI